MLCSRKAITVPSPTIANQCHSAPNLSLFNKLVYSTEPCLQLKNLSRETPFRTMIQPCERSLFSTHNTDRIGRTTSQLSALGKPNLLDHHSKQPNTHFQLASEINHALLPSPFILTQDQDIEVIQEILKNPDISEISSCFREVYHRDLLTNLSLYLGAEDLESALVSLISNSQFRENNYNDLRHAIHNLPHKSCVRVLGKLDQASSEDATGPQQLFDKTLRLRNYADNYTLDRLDLVSPPVTAEAKQVSLLSGSSYLFDGIRAKLEQTKDSNDHFHLIMHEYLDGEFVQALNKLLIKKHQDGVKIRIILCQGGSWQWESHHPLHSPNDKRAVDDLIQAGIDVKVHPLVYGLEHQKGIIYKANGQLGMMMGGGTICDQAAYPTGEPSPETPRDALDFPITNSSAIPEYYDMMIEAQGDPAVVWQNQFMQRWLYLDGTLDKDLTDSEFTQKYSLNDNPPNQVSISTTLPDQSCQMKLLYNVPATEPTAHPHLVEALKATKESIHIEIPYLLLNDILTICEQKAKEGVKVNYLLPGNSPRIAEWITNLAMTQWFKKQVTLPNVDIRLCNNRYNHGKIVAIDLKDNQAAKAFVMTGNLEPVISGGSRGGVAYDSTCMLYNMTQPLIRNITKIISRDFSDDFSTSLTPDTLDKQYWYEALGARLLYHKFQYFQ